MTTPKDRIKSLQRLVSGSDDGVIGNETLTKFQCKFSIPNKATVAHFFGNCHHESMGFSADYENLNYSAQALLRTFPKYFKKVDEAKSYERQPQKIANKVYGGRMGNNLEGDGWKYRGHGPLQLTGKSNFEAFNKWLIKKGYSGADVINNPSQVVDKYYWESAIFFFETNGLFNSVSDITEASIEIMCGRINGGINGLKDRSEKVKYYFSLFK